MDNLNLGQRLKTLRKMKKLTQQEVAEKLNYGINGASRYSNYENNLRLPNLDEIKIIAEYYNVTTDYLLGVVEEMSQDEKLIELMKRAEYNHGLKMVFHKTADLDDKELEKLSKMIDIIKDEE
jgi:Helix-turn-helix.